jgi:hypothetical protein
MSKFLLFHVSLEVFDDGSNQFGSILLNFADLFFEVQSACTILFAQKALLHIVAH